MNQYIAAADRYDGVTYRRVGKSGLKLPLISVGLWHNFGGEYNQDIKKLLCYGFDRGITHFDLANNYGPPPGSAEINFGKALKEALGTYRDELIISTKAGYLMWDGPYGNWGSKKYLVASLDQSLKRMGLDYVDIFYHHRYDPEAPMEEIAHTLDLVVRQGKALYVGISNYNAEQTEKMYNLLKSMGTPFVINQPRYNMIDRTPEKNGLIDTLKRLGLGAIVFSPLEQGILTDKYLKDIPSDSRAARVSEIVQDVNILRPVVAELNKIASSRGQTLAQMAIAWLLKNDGITSVLVGVKNIEQLKDNLDALKNINFDKDELKKIDELTSSIKWY